MSKLTIPKELVTKIKHSIESTDVFSGTYSAIISKDVYVKVQNSLDFNFDLFIPNSEAEFIPVILNWLRLSIDCKTPYKIDIGKYRGIFPISINQEDLGITVNFNIDNFDEKSWKDWFLIDEDIELGG